MQKTQVEFSWKGNLFYSRLKNYKFIIFIVSIIIVIILFWIFNSLFEKEINRDSYVILMNWNATLNSIPLKIENKEKIVKWDAVRTLWNNALAVLEWWDGSVTRLWWNTSIKIDNLYLSSNLEKINISFNLLSWKSWSTVISFLWDDSYFKESFRDSVAAVRWTIFDLDLDKDYLYVINHKVHLTKKNWDTIVVNEKKPFNLTHFNFIALEKFLKNFKDKSWEGLNYKIDKDLFKWLEKQISSNLNNLINIDNINIDKILNNNLKKKELYDKIIADYQKLNFVKPDNGELFKKKMELKDALIKLSSAENKNMLIQNSLYDFKDIVDSKNYDNIDILLKIFWNNKKILESLNFNNIIDFNNIPEFLRNKFNDLQINILNKTNDLKNIDIKNKISDLKIKADILKESLINK